MTVRKDSKIIGAIAPITTAWSEHVNIPKSSGSWHLALMPHGETPTRPLPNQTHDDLAEC